MYFDSTQTTATIDAVLTERRHELAFEGGFFFFDGKRLKQNIGALPYNSPETGLSEIVLLFPTVTSSSEVQENANTDKIKISVIGNFLILFILALFWVCKYSLIKFISK